MHVCIHTCIYNEQALSQWTRLKCLVQKDECLRSLEFSKLWPRILTGFREYSIINRLIAIMVILPVDTSGCERQFSLMNRIMGKWQTRMSHEVLRSCMVWHEANKHLSPDLWKLALAKVQCYFEVVELLAVFCIEVFDRNLHGCRSALNG